MSLHVEHEAEEKRFILRDIENENSFLRDSNDRSMGRALYHWAIWRVDESA